MTTNMTELLRSAVTCLDRNDQRGFRRIMELAKTEAADDGRAQGEILLLEVAGNAVASDEALATLLRAEKLLGGHSGILTPQTRFAENHFDAYTLWGRERGKADSLRSRGAHIKEITDAFERLTGFGAGVSECLQAQLTYYRGEFDEALRCSKVNIPKGYDGQISLINVYLLEIQAGIARHTIDQKLWHASYGRLRSIISGQYPASRTCREQAEVACAMMDMSLGCLHDIPAWAKVGDFGVIPAPHGYEIIKDRLLVGTLPSAMVAHMQYLAYSGDPVRALQAAAMIRDVLNIHSVILDAYILLLTASCYYELNRPEYAKNAVRDAMEIIVSDRLWLIAAEFIPAFGEAIYAAARELDAGAPERIAAIGEGYWNKLEPLRNDMLRGSTESLTKREQEVMSLAMEGHSNAEIAAALNVSQRTVKFHLGNVYQKLNLSRRNKFAGDIEQDGVARLATWVKK